MSRPSTVIPWAIACWASATLLAILARSVTPIDETRYLTVAWEMYRSGELWLLTLNGDVYSHKPPLLFWLTTLGWTVFGVQDVWPRALTAAFGLGVLWLTWYCALRICGGHRNAAALATSILSSTFVWMLFTGAVMFDIPLAFFSMAAITLLLGMQGSGRMTEWASVGVVLGFGILMKGPVALLQVLPLALLAPWWQPTLNRGKNLSLGRWYGSLGIAVLIAASIAAVWLVPALARGGPSLFDEFLWRQTIDRIATTTHHLRPWWFYLAVLPFVLMPWIALPIVWRGLRRSLTPSSAAMRVLVCWTLPVLFALSFFRGKQIHYVLPLLPAFAILMAHAMHQVEDDLQKLIRRMTALSITAVLGCYALIQWRFASAYDVTPMATRIATLQHADFAVGNVGRYHGQFNFAGRLQAPVTVIDDEKRWQRFLTMYPEGYVVTYSRSRPSKEREILMSVPFRSRYATLQPVAALRDRAFSEIQDF